MPKWLCLSQPLEGTGESPWEHLLLCCGQVINQCMWALNYCPVTASFIFAWIAITSLLGGKAQLHPGRLPVFQPWSRMKWEEWRAGLPAAVCGLCACSGLLLVLLFAQWGWSRVNTGDRGGSNMWQWFLHFQALSDVWILYFLSQCSHSLYQMSTKV